MGIEASNKIYSGLKQKFPSYFEEGENLVEFVEDSILSKALSYSELDLRIGQITGLGVTELNQMMADEYFITLVNTERIASEQKEKQ